MILTPRDLALLDALQRHGPLHTPYLYELTRHEGKDYTAFQKRLYALSRDGYLHRPEGLNHPLVFTDHKVYVLADKGRQLLQKPNTYSTPAAGGYPHMFMTSVITANIEIEAKKAGLQFIPQEEILLNAPESTRLAKKPLAIPTEIAYQYINKKGEFATYRSTKATEPDQLFGIDYGSGYRFFAVEADRGKEPETRYDLNENSIQRKFLAYKNVIHTGAAKKHFNIPNMFVLFVTTSEQRVENMLQLAKLVEPNGFNNLCFTSIPGFYLYNRTPKPLPHLFISPYLRAGRDPLALNKA